MTWWTKFCYKQLVSSCCPFLHLMTFWTNANYETFDWMTRSNSRIYPLNRNWNSDLWITTAKMNSASTVHLSISWTIKGYADIICTHLLADVLRFFKRPGWENRASQKISLSRLISCSSPRKSLVKGERFIRTLKRCQSIAYWTHKRLLWSLS